MPYERSDIHDTSNETNRARHCEQFEKQGSLYSISAGYPNACDMVTLMGFSQTKNEMKLVIDKRSVSIA